MVCHFSFFYPLSNFEICFLFHQKSCFHSHHIQTFVFPSSILFFSHCFRGWSDINLSLWFIHCLNKNFITHFVWFLWRKKRYNHETLSIDTVLNKWHFNGKIIFKMVHQKLVQDPFLILVNNSKQQLHPKIILKMKYFERKLWKSL